MTASAQSETGIPACEAGEPCILCGDTRRRDWVVGYDRMVARAGISSRERR